MNRILRTILLGLASIGFAHSVAQTFALQVKDDKITYRTDDRGNRILDFSYCGYRNSAQAIPDVQNVVWVSHQFGDQTARIQRAIDYVSSLKPDAQGFRGAVLLGEGEFTLAGSLRLHNSGVVLRGAHAERTVLIKTGVERGAFISLEGEDNLQRKETLSVVSPYVPVNSKTMQVALGVSLRKGDRIQVVRPGTKEWIASLGCDEFGGGISALGWKVGDLDLTWDRVVTGVNGNNITIDAPLSVALDAADGASYVIPYEYTGRTTDTGVENLTLVSDYNKKYPKDEDHCWTGISISAAENCWVRRVSFRHFAGSAVIVQPSASRITVEDCISRQPISEIGGMRRATFFTLGQLTLFQRCYSEQGIHDFAAGYCAAGPNAFVQCESKESLGFSGSIDSWACGLLFDVVNIDGHNLTYKNLGQDKNGAGWNTANSLFWQCTAAEMECYSPAKDAVNRAYGCWAQFSGDGEWDESNNHVQPR
nr:pectate lyase [Bacteroides sp.]